jgi:transcription antitermination factor NusG
MKDLFNGAGHPSAVSEIDSFRWIVSVFSGNGAVDVIKRANEKEIKTFFPIRRNLRGEYVALWSSYLFIEFVEGVTINLCRTTTRFIKIVSERDEDGILQPIKVRKEGINESLRLMTQGRFDDVTFRRRFHGKGTIVMVIDGVFVDQKVRLEEPVTPDMPGRAKVKVDLNGLKATIELFKLSL